mmetsp:Transcript_50849/g.57628  ORF Transcript_50849/g.57628 Transcript_50849/m.57628 type:complete len:157 (-) Transcript_50849:90-560(-)
MLLPPVNVTINTLIPSSSCSSSSIRIAFTVIHRAPSSFSFIYLCHRYQHSCWSYSNYFSFYIRPATATIRVVLCSHVAPSTAADGIIIIIIIIMSFVQQLFDSTDVLLLLLFQFVSLDVLFFVSYCRFCFAVLIVIVVTVIFSLSSSWSYSTILQS